MKPDVEKHLRIANETLREMEHLIAGGFYEAVAKRTYNAMLNAATAALLAKEVPSDTRQAIVSEFNNAFVKTGLFDEKFYKYFRQAFNSRDRVRRLICLCGPQAGTDKPSQGQGIHSRLSRIMRLNGVSDGFWPINPLTSFKKTV